MKRFTALLLILLTIQTWSSDFSFNPEGQAPGAEFNSSREDVRLWSRNRLATLKRAFSEAQTKYFYGDKSGAIIDLEQGLKDAAAEINPHYTGALTAKAIVRGLSYTTALKAATSGDRLQVKTIAHFLFEYYEFISKVNKNLDIPFYMPGNCHFCFFGKHREFEKKLITFSKKQVEMVLARMSETSREYGEVVTYPLGTPAGLLKSLELASNFMADDLTDSLHARRFSCVVDELDYLSKRLSTYNNGGASYINEFMAVQESTSHARKIVSGRTDCGTNINDNPRRRSDRRDNRGTTFQANRRSFKLYAGHAKSVQLDDSVYVKKLIISAEGIRHDAMFDVVVNGDVKGTIYVPGNDPTYFVTVEDQTSSIQFISRNGNAKISKILVVTE